MSPDSTPKIEPVCRAKRRPKWRASMPIGSVPIHMPITMKVMGSVASPLSGASSAPMMAPVETMTVLLPPASACATASTLALRRARASSIPVSDVVISAAAVVGGI